MENREIMSDVGLFIVGGGPGDPNLITLKGYQTLQRAEVILYDNLINKKLLEFAPKECKMVYVGKKPYGNCTPQDTIHQLIKKYTQEYQVVVRLKGGDPFVFGRGFEELLFARANGIPTHYIPGISSMQASGLTDIPLTHRGVSESVWMLTGTKKEGSLSSDLVLAMHSKATVVIYMGMKKLREIAAAYVENGMGDIPAAVIQYASLEKQRQVFCRAADLFEAVEDAGLGHPAIILIGNVVNVAKEMEAVALELQSQFVLHPEHA